MEEENHNPPDENYRIIIDKKLIKLKLSINSFNEKHSSLFIDSILLSI